MQYNGVKLEVFVMNDVTLTFSVPKSIADSLQAEAIKQNISLDSLLLDVIEEYFDTPDEQIIGDIREGLREGLRGDGLPALDVIAMIRKKISDESED